MRILVADDDRGVLSAYKAAFASIAKAPEETALSALASSLFSDDVDKSGVPAEALDFDVTYFEQGADAVAAVEDSIAANNPFHLAFLDMRMPPGIDGKETARRIRTADPDIHLVMVTGGLRPDFPPVDGRVLGLM